MSDPKQRILVHMNEQHQLAIVDYIVVYGKQPAGLFKHTSARLTNVTDQELTIGYETNPGESKSLELEWNDIPEPENLTVESLRDVKDKLVSMAKYAAAQQGYSHVRVTDVLYPTASSIPLYLFAVFIAATVYDRTLVRRLFVRDSLFQKVLPYIPEAAGKVYTFAEQYAGSIGLAAYAIHVLEIVVSTLPKLHKYRVPANAGLVWVVMHFFEGYLVIQRLNKATREH